LEENVSPFKGWIIIIFYKRNGLKQYEKYTYFHFSDENLGLIILE